MSNIYGRPTDVSSYFIMYQDSNSTTTQQAYNATFADLVDLKISGTNGFTFNGKVQGFCELLTNNSVPNTFWDGSNFSAVSIPIADANTNGGITNTTFIDWNTRLTGAMGSYTNGATGNYTNYVDWITDVYNVANTALTNADAAAGVATCANSSATAALNAIGTVPVGSNIMGIIGNVNNMPQNTNIIDWSANISSIATNANSNATNAINAIGNVPSGNSVMGYIGDVNNIPTPYNNIIDWVNGELGDISSQLTNIIGS